MTQEDEEMGGTPTQPGKQATEAKPPKGLEKEEEVKAKEGGRPPRRRP